MSPVKEKFTRVSRGVRRIPGEPEPSQGEGPRVSEADGGREGRRAGILLIVLGCVLMALAAGEGPAAAQLSAVLAP